MELLNLSTLNSRRGISTYCLCCEDYTYTGAYAYLNVFKTSGTNERNIVIRTTNGKTYNANEFNPVRYGKN